MPNFTKTLFGGSGKKAVSIQRECYTMASTNGSDAEIIMYGEVVEDRPVDWWTGEPVEGSYIVLSEFLDDLKQIENADRISMRINSIGGNAYASITIHNRLRELKGELTAVVDGVAMSGGSLIMCAADKVQVNPSSLIMIHRCLAMLIGRYNAEELEKIVASNESVDKAQAAIYKRKTGMEEADILAMMGDETYMTGSEAVDKGFADELLDAEASKIAASADCRTLYVNGRAIHSAFPHINLPNSVPTVDTADSAATINPIQPAQTGGNEGGKTMAQTLEELKKENPDLANELMAQAQAAASAEIEASGGAVEAERKRIREIDEVSALYSDEMVQEAKYGANPCTAQELTYRAAKEMAKQGKKFLDGMADDAGASGAQQVTALPGADDGALDNGSNKTPEQLMAEARNEVQTLLGNKKEG